MLKQISVYRNVFQQLKHAVECEFVCVRVCAKMYEKTLTCRFAPFEFLPAFVNALEFSSAISETSNGMSYANQIHQPNGMSYANQNTPVECV